MIKIGVIEDDFLVREELVGIIKSSSKLEYVLSSESAENFLKYFPKNLDVILLDIQLPGMTGIEAIPKIKAKAPNVEIVILSASNDSDKIFGALRAGASGYLLKEDSIELIEQKVLDLIEGIPPLSPIVARTIIAFFNKKPEVIGVTLTNRETQVLHHLIEGLSYKEIADKMINSINSIRTHVKNIYKKLNVHSRAEIMKMYLDGKIKLTL
jgi:DNA-binding NarL/FixJ family response regulator